METVPFHIDIMKFLIAVFICFISYNSYGAYSQACQATLGSNNIYYVRDGSILFNGVPQYRNDNFTNFYTVSQVSCFYRIGSQNTSCYIKGYSGAGDAYGTLINFSRTPADCPLDDYIWLLILPLGVFGFYIMRKSSLPNLA